MTEISHPTTPHVFLGMHHALHERRSWSVAALTSAMMVVEIVLGLVLGSMALLADGLHMATHAGVMVVTSLAYALSRRHAEDPRFVFGTAKIGDLAAFTSALGLGLIALLVLYESINRILHPVSIAYGEAMLVAAAGFAVNVVSALMLRSPHTHDHHHAAQDHSHLNEHGLQDNNFRAAYVHILADMGTSLLAVFALGLGRYFGLVWMDAAAGIIGALVILSWAWTLVRNAAAVLLDVCPDPKLALEVRQALEENATIVTDFHLWRVGPGHYGLVVSLCAAEAKPVEVYKQRLARFSAISHSTIEVCEKSPQTILSS